MFHKPMSVLIGDDGSPEKVRFRRYAQMLDHEHTVTIGSLSFLSKLGKADKAEPARARRPRGRAKEGH
jgi:hypothetical protein